MVGQFEFSVSGAIAIVLNLGAFLYLAEKIRQLTVEQKMRIAQAFAAKEEMTKQALLELLSDDAETISRVNAAFREGNKRWRPHLTSIFGRTEASRFFEELNSGASPPR